MINRLPHVRAPDGDPDICIYCREEWVDLLTLYETDECSVRLRAEVGTERAAVVAFMRAAANAPHPSELGAPMLSPSGRGLLLLHADFIERGEHRREETE
jgi:hypothetical protein